MRTRRDVDYEENEAADSAASAGLLELQRI